MKKNLALNAFINWFKFELNVTFMVYRIDKRLAYLTDPQYRIDFRRD